MRAKRGIAIRLLQVFALYAPGSMSLRVWLHRRRGVTIGREVFIGTDVILETDRPELICIGDRVTIGIRDTIIAHFRDGTPAERNEPGARYSVVIEDDVYVGPHVVILPGVRIGAGAVVAAGSVVTADVRPLTLVQGNPARPVAKCGMPLGLTTSLSEFYRSLRPIRLDASSSSDPDTA
jgi:acetyltransferase-like isoleucine patch superfamily enzyme